MSDLPLYNTTLGDFLQKITPDTIAKFKGVTTQVYPLRADIETLRHFCNDNLNRPSESNPPPIRIEPVAPWVLMQVCYYGSMGEVEHKGFVSQHEIAFGFPVTWQQTEGQKTSRELAMFYPFIFVDNSISLTLGRQVYGWPKAGIEVDRRLPNFDPRDPIVLSICRKRYGKEGSGTYHPVQTVYGEPGISENLLRVIQKPTFASTWPGVDLFLVWPRMVGSILNAAAGMLDTAGRTLSGFAPPDLPSLGRDLQSLGDIMVRWYAYMNDFTPALFRLMGAGASSGTASSNAPILTVKQIRDVDNPQQACYLGTIRSQICVDSVTSGGILFNPALPDLSGGIEINLLRTDEEPIVQQLGILSSGKVKIHDDDGGDGKIADVIHPVMPFWAQADVTYKAAVDYQLARTKWSLWSTKGLTIPHKPDDKPTPIDYRNYGSGTGGEVQGPISSDQFILHGYPILVDSPQKLQEVVNSYLENSTLKFQFNVIPIETPSGDNSVVLMLVSRFNNSSVGAKGQPFYDRVLTFAVPVTYESESNGVQLAFVHLYSFAGTELTVLTDNEVYGRFTIKSTLESPGSLWVDSPSAAGQGLLTVKTTVFTDPESNKPDSQPAARLEPVVELYSHNGGESPPPDASGEPSNFYKVASQLLKLEGRGLDNRFSFFFVALKQVRDAQAVDRAALQSIVGVKRDISVDPGNFMYQAPVKVVIYDHPGLEIGQKLALAQLLQAPPPVRGKKTTIVSNLGFYLTGKLTETAYTLFFRTGDFDDGKWHKGSYDITQ